MTLRTKIIFFASLLAIGVASEGGEGKKANSSPSSTASTASESASATTTSGTEATSEKTDADKKKPNGDKTASSPGRSEAPQPEKQPQQGASTDEDMIDDAPSSETKGGSDQD